MEVLEYKINHSEKIILLEFELTKNLEPQDLASIKLPDPVKEKFASKLLILSGRGPIWLYGFMIHHFHPCKAIAIYDPRLDCAVIVETHSIEHRIGEVVKI
ncbi:MAG TPA: CRISPR-associated ring nuclease Crn3/Csx3 [Caldisericia bacterium]|nr:CRISPR-associated ring nuclease Crn3/Csx3 [Caldisericia bacterium]HPO29173.1 CRISPR-associated ring nuclease Crn3/Csx3 [Caldisericia bacterium]